MADREMKFIYREPDKAPSLTCAEMLLTLLGILVFFGIILGGWR